ncbi:4-hydroxybenzoate polyprenyltransferase [Nocardioides terrae]|uniref:4-hydroxybenzoate polyprenyltransferase n=1 Tax=Nocardioides terrae TaxID=574651 RepID=A0A1I1FUS7_9ACTN|nr:UbiA family prenyltransferase [Nocardioides terrae]SFC02776.1 4-hydroxybenzoate polyprenyltransferase [Nocardioides terrae]
MSSTVSRPLVVDLDGTLVATDTLHEAATAFLTHSPLGVFRLAGWLRRGKAHLKAELAARTELDASVLPYRGDVLTWLEAEQSNGRRLVLATASAAWQAQAVADQLGIFHEVIATADGVNLKGSAKREVLVERFGERGFDYLGDHGADLSVWGAAATGHVVVGARRSLAERVGRVTEVGMVFPSPEGRLRALGSLLRPYQWVKNALVLVPLFTAQRLDDASAVLQMLLAVVAFCLVASSVYVLNDLADVVHDRHHPRKRLRPFASGRVGLLTGWMLWPALAVVGFGLSVAFLPALFVAALAAYLVLTTAYTFRLKRQPVLDVVVLGLLYTSRIVAGAAAIDVELSMWLLTFSMFFFLSLALTKRVNELTRIRRTMGQVGVQVRGRGYVETDLELLSSYGVASSVAAVVIFSLYVDDPKTSVLYDTPELLWCGVPVLLAWLMRVWLLAHRGTMDEDPIIFATRDRASLVAALLVVAVFVAAKVVTM